MEGSWTGNNIEKNVLKKIVALQLVELICLWNKAVLMSYKQYILKNSLYG